MTASLEPYRRGRPLCPPGSDLKETLAYPNGDVVRWEYEPHRDLLTLVSNATHSAYRYTYDVAGRRVSKNDERYRYNVRGELVLAMNVVDGMVFAYAYDDIGNRLWSREFGTNCTYVANELNQYTNIVRGSIAERPAFDADGNQTDIVTGTGRWHVKYNGENRPVRWTRPADGTTLVMAYDSRGRRVRSNTDTFVYGDYLNVGTTVWDPTEPVATRPLAWLSNGGPAYYFHDGNKNVSDVAANDGTTQYLYAPFGKSEARGALVGENPYRFSSEIYEDILGLTCYNYRIYDFSGRWISRDPIFEHAFSILNSYNNLTSENVEYMFVQNSPSRFSDYLGLDLITKSCDCENVVLNGVKKVNEALNKGKCKEWFKQHKHDYNSGSPSQTVVCHKSKFKLPCWFIPAWTMPFSRIGICLNQTADYNSVAMASIIIHELAHHYCTKFWGREDCAMSAQDACAEEIQ